MLFGAKKIKCNVKYKDKKYIYELDKHNTIKDIYNLFSNEESVPSNISSLTIKLCTNKLPFNKNDYDTPLISFDKDKYNELWFEITKPYNCPGCQKIISKYCLICGEYFCSKCKNSKHDKHDFVDIDPTNFKESVYLWNININANLSNDMTHFNQLKDFIQDNALVTKIKIWKDNLIKKLNTFEKFINEICDMCNKIGNNYINRKSEELNKLMLDLSKTEQLINKELSIGKDKKFIPNNNYFSFDEAEELIQKLKINYNDIKTKNTDIKDISEIENFNTLNDLLGNISSQFDDLTKNGLKIFDSYKKFFEKYDNSNENDKTTSIFFSNKNEKYINTISNASNNTNKKLHLIKNGKILKNKIYNIGMSNNNLNNLSLAIKDTTLTSKDSYSTCNKTNSKINKTKKVFNSFKKDKYYLNTQSQGPNLYNELNLSKAKLKTNENEGDNLYSDRYNKYPQIDRNDRINFLPLITKI